MFQWNQLDAGSRDLIEMIPNFGFKTILGTILKLFYPRTLHVLISSLLDHFCINDISHNWMMIPF